MYARGATPEIDGPPIGGVRVPGGDPRHVGSWLDVRGVERSVARAGRSRRFGANERATITFAVVNRCLTLGEARRHRVAGRVEVRMSLVDARVDDPDLDSLPGVARPGPQIAGRADLLHGAGVRLRRIARRTRTTSRTPGSAFSLRRPRSGASTRVAVDDEAVPPTDVRAGKPRGQLSRGMHAAARRAGSAPARPACASGRRVERHDHLRVRRAFERRRSATGSTTQRDEHDCEAEHGEGVARLIDGLRRSGSRRRLTRGARLESDVRADVAELVDAHGSGPCARKGVEVQVLSSACRTIVPARRPSVSDHSFEGQPGARVRRVRVCAGARLSRRRARPRDLVHRMACVIRHDHRGACSLRPVAR